MVFCAQLGHKLYRLPTAHLICFINMSVCPDVRLSVVCPSVCLSVRRWGFVCAQLLYKLARELLTAPGCEPPASSYKLPTAASDRLHTLDPPPLPYYTCQLRRELNIFPTPQSRHRACRRWQTGLCRYPLVIAPPKMQQGAWHTQSCTFLSDSSQPVYHPSSYPSRL